MILLKIKDRKSVEGKKTLHTENNDTNNGYSESWGP